MGANAPRAPRRRAPRRATRRPARKPTTASAPRRKPAVRRRRGPVRHTAVNGLVTQSVVKHFSTKKNATPAVARSIKMVGTPNVYFLQTPVPVFGAVSGRQNVASFQHVGKPDLTTIRNSITTNNIPIRYALESYQCDIQMTNQSTAPIEVEIWDLKLTRDVLRTFLYNTSLGTYSVAPVPEEYWYTGMLLGSNLPSTTPVSSNPGTFIGASLYDSQLFKEYFRSVKKTIVTLAQGATHRHEVLMSLNYVVNDALVLNESENSIVGLTTFTMVNVKGYPAGGPSTGISTAVPNLMCIQSKRYKYTWAQDLSSNIFYSQNLGTPETLDIVNVGSGQIEPANVVT